MIHRACRLPAQRDKLFLRGARGGHVAKRGLAAHQELQPLLILGPRRHHLAQPFDQRQVLRAHPVGRGEFGGKARLCLLLREPLRARRLGGGDALCKGQVRIARRTHLRIEPDPAAREQQHAERRHRDRGPARLPARLPARAQLCIGREDPARDLGAQALGLLRTDQAAPAIAVDLAQLVAVDAQVIGGGRLGPRAPAQHRQRQQHPRAERQRPGDDPETHEPILLPPCKAARRRKKGASGPVCAPRCRNVAIRGRSAAPSHLFNAPPSHYDPDRTRPPNP